MQYLELLAQITMGVLYLGGWFVPNFGNAMVLQQQAAESGLWEIWSKNGVLDITMIDSADYVTINNEIVLARVWNKTFQGPLIHLKPGDFFVLRLRNDLAQSTNFHLHGMRISPLPPGDDVLVQHPGGGKTYVYNFSIPLNHPPGLFWYHSHAWYDSEWQVFNGMSGAIEVEGIFETFPTLKTVRRKYFLLRDIQIINGTIPAAGQIDSGAPTTRLVNTLRLPYTEMNRNEVQSWAFANIGPDITYKLSFPRDCVASLQIIAIDALLRTELIPFHSKQTYLLGPGARVQFLITAPEKKNKNNNNQCGWVQTERINTGKWGDTYPKKKLFSIRIGQEKEDKRKLPNKREFPFIMNLANRKVDVKRKVYFSENPNTNVFYIDGEMFNATKVNWVSKLGTIEEWEVINLSREWHWFHIHQGAFQVVEMNGKKVKFTGYQDTVLLDVSKKPVVIRIPFLDPVIMGKYVYHCHIEAHMDNGMMQVIQVVK